MSNPNRASTVLRPAQRGLDRFNAHRQERTTVHWFTWRHLRLKLEETRHYTRHGWTMLQLHVIGARDVPCPVTATGYLAHFIDEEELAMASGAVQAPVCTVLPFTDVRRAHELLDDPAFMGTLVLHP